MTKEEREELERRAAELAAKHRQSGINEWSTPDRFSNVNQVIQVEVKHRSNWFLTLCWILTIVGVIVGGIIVLVGVFLPGAPQQAAAAAIGLACAILPYCLARAVSEINK